MPMALRPGTTATRAETADIERAMSSASPITRDDLMPGAGSNSYSVTTGPGCTLTISPLTPKSSSTPSSSRAFCSSASSEIFDVDFFGSASIVSAGSVYSPRSIGVAARLGAAFSGPTAGVTLTGGAISGSGATGRTTGALAPTGGATEGASCIGASSGAPNGGLASSSQGARGGGAGFKGLRGRLSSRLRPLLTT